MFIVTRNTENVYHYFQEKPADGPAKAVPLYLALQTGGDFSNSNQN
jgi:hypothetical protein